MPAENLQESLRLDEVVRRFVESAETLRRVADQLNALRDAETVAQASGQSLTAASSAVSRFVESAEKATAEMAAASETARRALEGSASILEGTDLETIRTALQELTSGQSSAFNSLELRLAQAKDDHLSELRQGSARIVEQIRALDSRVDELAKVQETQLGRDLEAKSQELDKVRSVLSWRQRRKLGI
jgi:uncharacterized phage infection (PIP) family protein YhgE